MKSESILDVSKAVKERYSEAAKSQVAALCCPVDYNKEYLKVIPEEVIERDYGCGDPSAYVRKGETVLDLGSGGGKICFIASQVVGAEGKVIGVDINDDMLQLAKKSAKIVGESIGYHNIEFRRGNIQDLRLDRDRVDNYLRESPIKNHEDLSKLEQYMEDLRNQEPMIASNSVDVVVSNCVLNLVATDEKAKLLAEIFRVLKRGGRAVISDIVSDEFVPEEMRADPELWSGCISGAFQEMEFLKAFEEAGFYGVELVKRDEQPWQTVNGIEFRSATVIAYKGKQGECWDHNEALVYKGPFSSVADDDGHVFPRGERVAVCRKTFDILTKEPYSSHFYEIKPRVEVPAGAVQTFPCDAATIIKSPRQTKGEDYSATTDKSESSCC